MKFSPMTKSTRAGIGGKMIRCPHCGTTTRIYHFSWCALGCQGCDKMVDKYDYDVETKVKTKNINLSKDQWQCYSDTPNDVIKTVNKFFTYILFVCETPILAQKTTYAYLERYVTWGFLDSECCQVATDMINKYYNSDINRWQCMSEELIKG